MFHQSAILPNRKTFDDDKVADVAEDKRFLPMKLPKLVCLGFLTKDCNGRALCENLQSNLDMDGVFSNTCSLPTNRSGSCVLMFRLLE